MRQIKPLGFLLLFTFVSASLTVISFLPVPHVHAATATFQPSTIDNYLDNDDPTVNYGTATYLHVYAYSTANERSILMFDMSGTIPAGSTISSATLYLYYYLWQNNDPSGRTYWVYRMTTVDWTETGSCWSYRYGTTAWTTAGGDYTTTDGASATVPASYGWMTWTVTAQVQYAVNNVGQKAYFLVKDGTEGTASAYLSYFYSREYTTDTTLRPKLVVEYVSQRALNLKVVQADGVTVLAGAAVTMNNGSDRVKTVPASGWTNYTGITNGLTVTVKVKWQNSWVNGTWTITMNNDETRTAAKTKVYLVSFTYTDSDNPSSLNVTFASNSTTRTIASYSNIPMQNGSITVQTPYVWHNNATARRNLVSWNSGSSEVYPTRGGTGSYTTPSITIDSAKTIAFTSLWQYKLAASGGQTGDGWYDNRLTVTLRNEVTDSLFTPPANTTITITGQTAMATYPIASSNQTVTVPSLVLWQNLAGHEWIVDLNYPGTYAYKRTRILTSLSQTQTPVTFYPVDPSVNPVHSYTLSLTDLTGNFANLTSTKLILARLDKIVLEARFDVEKKASVWLTMNERYYVTLDNGKGVTMALGFLTADTGYSKTLTAGGIVFRPETTLAWQYVYWDTWCDRNAGTLTVNYNDTLAQTSEVVIKVYNASFALKWTYNTTAQGWTGGTLHSTLSVTWNNASEVKGYFAKGYYVQLTYKHGMFGTRTEIRPDPGTGVLVPLGINLEVLGFTMNSYQLIALFTLTVFAMCFSAAFSGIGAILVVLVCAMFTYWGWLPAAWWPIIALAIFIAIIYKLTEKRMGVD